MSDKISLKEAERQVFRAAFQDGLLDILIGCLFLQLAFVPFLAPALGDFWSSVLFLPLWVGVILGISWLRKHVLSPRLGTVRLGRSRQLKMRKFNIALGIVLLAGLALGLAAFFSVDMTPGWVIAGLFGLMLLLLFGLAAFYLDSRRMLLYGVLNLFTPLLGEWLYQNQGVPHHGWPVAFGAMAAITLCTGLIIFVRLLRANPVPPLGPPQKGA